MKLNSLFKTLIITGAVTATLACKKDKDKETLPSLEGSMKFQTESYIRQGGSIRFTPEGVTHPKNGQIGYAVSISVGGKEIKRDTIKRFEDEKVKEFTYTFPKDTVGTYTVTAIAYADGYYSTTANKSAILVGDYTLCETTEGTPDLQLKKNPNPSLTGTGFDVENDLHVDFGDRRYFYTEATDGLWWMQNNLAEEGGLAFSKEEALSQIYGRFYNFENARKACPKGWRLPTAAEWDALAAKCKAAMEADSKNGQTVPGMLAADAKFNATEMWEYWPANSDGMGEITNHSQMAFIPVGYANTVSGHFDGIFQYATFWADDTNPKDESQAKVYYIYNYSDIMMTSYMDKASYGASVRCVREK